MSRMRWMSVAGGLGLGLVLVASWQGSWGQTAKKARAIAPEECLSAESVIYFRLDGTQAHQADWEKTAAYKAIVKSGLAAAIDKWLVQLSDRVPPADVGRKLLWQIFEQGVSVGVVPPDDPQSPEFRLTAVLHNGAELEPLISGLFPGEDLQAEIELDDFRRTIQQITIPQTESTTLDWWKEGPHLVVSIGSTDLDESFNVLRGTSPNITSQPDWKRRNAIDDGQVLTSVAWIDFQKIIEKYRDVEIPEGSNGAPIRVGQILEVLGVDNLTELIGRQGYDGPVSVSRVDFVHDGPRRGLLKLLEGRPMTLESLPPLPEYNSLIMAGALDFAAIYDSVLKLAHEVMDKFVAPESAKADSENGLAQINDAIGGSLRDDLLANLGPVHALFNDPANGVAGFGAGYALEIRNPDTLRDILDRLVELVPEPRNPNEPRLTRTEKNDREYVSFGQPGIPFFPTLTIDDDWLILGTSSQSVDAFVQRVRGELDKWTPSDEQQALLDKLPKEFVSFSLNDPREGILAINQYLPVVQAALGPQGLPMPELPSAERIVKPLFPSAYVTTMDEHGLHYHSRQALPGLPLVGSLDNMSVGTTAVAIALLLPAVQQAREAARRTQSKNNLKQLGLALHNYHDTHNRFPAGIIAGQKKPEDSLSWYGSILPYMDQAELYQELDQQKAWDDDANKIVAETIIPSFRNPSAVEVKLNGYAQTDYAGVAGLGKDGPTKKVTDKGAGFFAYNRATRIQDITDGTSNTLMVGDISKDRGPWLQGGKATIRPFVDKPYINGPDGWGGIHTGGANFLLGDGAVRFVSEKIDPQVMEALITIRGGEVIGDF